MDTVRRTRADLIRVEHVDKGVSDPGVRTAVRILIEQRIESGFRGFGHYGVVWTKKEKTGWRPDGAASPNADQEIGGRQNQPATLTCTRLPRERLTDTQ